MKMKEYTTVFVVDDDAAVRKSLVRLLKSADYFAESFASADEFLECWKKNPVPGCVLLDIQMPGLDGLQLQDKLQNSTDGIPIIFITGHGDIPSSVKAMKAGAVDFFPNPSTTKTCSKRSARPFIGIIRRATTAPGEPRWQSVFQH